VLHNSSCLHLRNSEILFQMIHVCILLATSTLRHEVCTLTQLVIENSLLYILHVKLGKCQSVEFSLPGFF
jgi:hypothetical protein